VNDNNEIFVVKDTILSSLKVQPVYFSDKQVVVKGVPDGELMLAKQVPGAYNGMLVQVVNENATKGSKEDSKPTTETDQ
jgi:hypothetical protein